MRVRFGPFTLDSGTRELAEGGRPIHLQPKAFDLLCVLLERRPEVVDKATLLGRIWPDTFVVEANLNVLVGEIRRALSDTAQRPRFVRTVHRIGFAFCGEAVDLDSHQLQTSDGRPRFWLTWKDQTFVLAEGENIIGRDPKCHVWVDGTGVSRRHARIRVVSAEDRVELEDMNSTNGTLLQRGPVATPVTLHNGDLITIGSVELTFRAWIADQSRPTERIGRKSRT